VLRYLLPGKVDAFYRAYPLAQLRLLARSVEQTVNLLKLNECDLGVIPETRLPEELMFRKVASFPTCLLFPKGHPLARRAREDFLSLLTDGSVARFPLILLEVEREDARIQRAFEQLNIPLNVALEVSTIDTLKHYVARGLGGALLPSFALTAEDHARLDTVEIPEAFGAGTTYGIACRRTRRRSALLTNLLGLLNSFDRT
jgi:DNA-binding transcriptional LysR family regulator